MQYIYQESVETIRRTAPLILHCRKLASRLVASRSPCDGRNDLSVPDYNIDYSHSNIGLKKTCPFSFIGFRIYTLLDACTANNINNLHRFWLTAGPHNMQTFIFIFLVSLKIKMVHHFQSWRIGWHIQESIVIYNELLHGVFNNFLGISNLRRLKSWVLTVP